MSKHKSRIIWIVLTMAILLFFSTGYFLVLNLFREHNFEAYNILEYSQEDEDFSFKYQGEKYFIVEPNIFDVNLKDSEAVEISWHLNFPFSTKLVYKSYNLDKPDYIYNRLGGTQVYFSESYDYKSDIVTINDIDTGLKFSDIFNEENYIEYDALKRSEARFNLRLKSHPEVYTQATVYLENDVYYISFENSVPYEVSDEFLEILFE